MFPEHVERSFLDPEYSFVAVRRILRTLFAKQKFAQLRTIFAEYSQLCSRTNVRQIKNGLKAKKSDHIHSVLEILHCLPDNTSHSIKKKSIKKNQLSASIPSLERPFIICPISFNLIHQQDNYDLHPTHEPLSPLGENKQTNKQTKYHLVKDRFLTLAHLFGTICLKRSATLILPPLLKPPSRRTCLITIYY